MLKIILSEHDLLELEARLIFSKNMSANMQILNSLLLIYHNTSINASIVKTETIYMQRYELNCRLKVLAKKSLSFYYDDLLSWLGKTGSTKCGLKLGTGYFFWIKPEASWKCHIKGLFCQKEFCSYMALCAKCINLLKNTTFHLKFIVIFPGFYGILI